VAMSVCVTALDK